MTTTTALPADVEALMRGLRLPHARAIAADVLATARAQRWDPTEVIKALLVEESAGRARSMLASRPQSRRIPDRENLRRLGPSRLVDPAAHPTGFTNFGMGWAPGEPGGLRARRHRQDVLPRSPRAESH
jgi:hypothetical protein